MPVSFKDDDTEGKGGSPSLDVDVVEDDDEGSVEVTEDGTPVQDRATTSATDDDESDDDDGDTGTDTDDKATLERKRKKAAQREASKLRRQLAVTEARQEALEREMEELRAERLERARGTVQERVTAAEQAYETALEDGDAKGIVAAQRALREAETEAGEWERKSRPAPRASAQPTSNPLVEQFVAKHGEWFDINGGDTDSVIVRQLSAEIANEGIDPSTKRHFDELDRRMARYLPHRAGASKPKPRATAAAPGGGGGNGSSSRGGSIEIPKATIAGFEQALGYDWNNPTDRAKIIKRVQETRRSRGDQA